MNQHPRGFTIDIQPHPKWETELILKLGAEDAARLSECLSELAEAGKEIRLHLGEGEGTYSGAWSSFWKLRDEDNRVLLAHPDHDEWVVTFALQPALLARTIEEIRAGRGFELHGLGRVNRLGNLALRIEFT